jgi:hypothetical protein
MKRHIVTRREKRKIARREKRFPVLRHLRERVDYWAEGGEFDRNRRVYQFANGSILAIGPSKDPLVGSDFSLTDPR